MLAPVTIEGVLLATWNVNSLTARLPRVTEWLERVQPDVLCMQETKVTRDAFPSAALEELGYESAAESEGRYNGVAILSRVGLEAVTSSFPGQPGFPGPEARALGADCGGLRVWSLYVPNGRSLEDPHYQYKLRWLAALRAAAAAELAAGAELVLCGDFNVAPADHDVWDPQAFAGLTHVSAAEREAIAALVAEGLTDVQPRAIKGEPFTYWDYRAGMFHKGMGMRIDLVLAAAAVAERITDAWIDRDARKGSKPSDHAPVLVRLD